MIAATFKIGGTWTGPDGTVYDVVAASDVGDRPRWWVGDSVASDPNDKEVPWEPPMPSHLHCNDVEVCGGAALALVLREPDDADIAALPDDMRQLFANHVRAHLAAQAKLLDDRHDDEIKTLTESRHEWMQVAVTRATRLGEFEARIADCHATIARLQGELSQANAREASGVRSLDMRVSKLEMQAAKPITSRARKVSTRTHARSKK